MKLPFSTFAKSERINLFLYIVGIMLYKFSLETLTGCFSSLMIYRTGKSSWWSICLSMNYAAQCLGSILVAPLAKRYKTNVVLSRAILLFGLTVVIVPIMEIATQGGFETGLGNEKMYNNGHWPVLILLAIYPIIGIFHGMIELIRRVIPSDIVGANEIKLKEMDSTVHIFYEVAGTTGALLSRYWIGYFNYAYALTVIPISFTLSSLVWMRIRLDREHSPTSSSGTLDNSQANLQTLDEKPSIFAEMLDILRSFAHSIAVGAKLVFTRRSLFWLVLAYSLPLVLHRYLENVLFPQYAIGLGRGSYQQTLVAGSNLGELLGALFVLLFSSSVATPLPWLRLDALALGIVWIFPFADPIGGDIDRWVWIIFCVMIVVSFGWAAGDVSLVAYVQSRLVKIENTDPRTSPLGAVMAFLYVIYIVIFAIVASVMGLVMDSFLNPLVQQFGKLDKVPVDLKLPKTQEAMVYTAGVFMSVCSVIILAATFIPKGSFAFNPKVIDKHEKEDDDEVGPNSSGTVLVDEDLKSKYQRDIAMTEMIVG